MLDVRLMRHEGVRLTPDEATRQPTHTGDFVLDIAHGAKRLRVRNPWSGGFAPVELYEPALVSAKPGILRWRGFERVGDKGVVQEWAGAASQLSGNRMRVSGAVHVEHLPS